MEPADRGSQQATGAAVANNLPHYLTSFVGREGELTALKRLVARSRMVTLTGPGGAGKSRLAAALGRACLNLWPDGAWWVELAPVSDPRQVAGAVVSSLALPGRGPAQDVVIAWLAARRALLVLDNCEHLVAACAEFCQAALERCPQLSIIATSREAVGVPGETHSPVSSLRVSDAVRLFEARAVLVQPSFKVAARNLDSVTEISERVDRLPLAIELAAARMGVLTEQEILSQLSDRFHLLTGGNRTAPERQQTLIATIDWSYRLLTEEEALLFRRLSVFRGGFTLASAKVICADGIAGSVLDLVAGLVRKSMVVAERTEGSGTRYRLLESQLAYAEGRLREAGELEAMRRRHYESFLNCLETKLGPRALPPVALGVAQAAWVARERANLWAASGWARRNAYDMGLLLALRLAQSTSADITAMRSLLVDVLEHSPEKGVLRADALVCVARLAYSERDYDAARRAAAGGVALAREVGDVEAVAYALLHASVAESFQKPSNIAIDMLEEAASLLKVSNNLRLVMRIRNNLGLVAVERCDYTSARDTLVDCVAFARADNDVTTTANYLDSLAWAQLGLDDHQAAAASWKEALSKYRSVLDNRGTIYCLSGLSCVASATRDDQRGLRLAAAASRLSDEWSYHDPWLRRAEEFTRRSRSRLGVRKSEVVWNQGWASSAEQAVAYALSDAGEPLEEGGPLTRREKEIAALVAGGHRNREIAEQLAISRRTVDAHVEHIRNKLGHQSRAQVAAWATAHGLSGTDANLLLD